MIILFKTRWKITAYFKFQRHIFWFGFFIFLLLAINYLLFFCLFLTIRLLWLFSLWTSFLLLSILFLVIIILLKILFIFGLIFSINILFFAATSLFCFHFKIWLIQKMFMLFIIIIILIKTIFMKFLVSDYEFFHLKLIVNFSVYCSKYLYLMLTKI